MVIALPFLPDLRHESFLGCSDSPISQPPLRFAATWPVCSPKSAIQGLRLQIIEVVWDPENLFQVYLDWQA
jgi:hypothetical protein